MKIVYLRDRNESDRYRIILNAAASRKMRVIDVDTFLMDVECNNVIGVMLQDREPRFHVKNYKFPKDPTVYYSNYYIEHARLLEIARIANIDNEDNIFYIYDPEWSEKKK